MAIYPGADSTVNHSGTQTEAAGNLFPPRRKSAAVVLVIYVVATLSKQLKDGENSSVPSDTSMVARRTMSNFAGVRKSDMFSHYESILLRHSRSLAALSIF